MRDIKTIGDLLTRTKEAELCATVWTWNTDYSAERQAFLEFTSNINYLVDKFVLCGIGRFGLKEEGLSFNSIKYTQYDLNYFKDLLEDIENFYVAKRIQDLPELAAILTEIIELITITLYKLNLN